MRKERLYYSIILQRMRNPRKKAEYLKKKKIFGEIGENCSWGPAILPLYAELIKLHNNVYIHKTAKLIPHDMLNRFLVRAKPDSGLSPKERLGCIEIMDNVYVGMNVLIMPDVKIGSNCVISAGSVVMNDVPDNSIVAGNPARVVGHFDSFIAVRKKLRVTKEPFRNQELPAAAVKDQWRIFDELHSAGFITEEAWQPEEESDDALTGRLASEIAEKLSEIIHGVDFMNETALIDQHILDSLGLISVIALLEEQYDCKIPFSAIDRSNFNSVTRMAQLIVSLSSPQAAEVESVQRETTVLSPLKLSPEDTEKTVVQRIMEHAAAQPKQIAVIADEKKTSYAELAGMILAVADWLTQRGVRKGDRVIVQAIHNAVCIACYYAVHLIGAVLVPVEKSAAVSRISQIAEETDGVLVISTASEQSRISWHGFDEIRELAKDAVFDAKRVLSYPSLDDACEMIFTTGTTGKSKGVLMAHRHISWYVYSVAKCVGMKANNRFLLTTPLNHAGGLRRTHLTLANGCCMVYLDGLNDLEQYFRYIREFGVTSLYLPPVALRILLTRTGSELAKYKDQIDFVYSSSSSLPLGDCRELQRLLPNTRLYNAYEASETPGVCAFDYNVDEIPSGCLGRANEGVEVAILSEDGVIAKEPDRQGQICIKSRMNMLSYDRAPELTASVMKDGWFVSSDIGRLDKDGNLYIVGRKGDVINIGGYKIAPTEVEETALLSGMLKECVCVEALDEIRVPYLKLIVVPEQEDSFSAKELVSFLSERLEAYKIPRKIELTDAVAKTFNGKINRLFYRQKA